MSEAPLMPKATAVWLVENTSLTFDQIAEFCKLHPLEVKGIADGEVATGIKGHDPIASGQLTREEIAAGEKNTERRLTLAVAKVRLPEFKKQRGARYTPLSRRQDRPNAILWLLRNHAELKDAQIMRLVGTTKIDARGHSRPPSLELGQSAADGPGDARPLLADRSRFRSQSRRQGSPEGRGGSRPDPGARRIDHRQAAPPTSQADVFGAAKPKAQEEKIDVDSVFGKLKELKSGGVMRSLLPQSGRRWPLRQQRSDEGSRTLGASSESVWRRRD